MIRLVDPAQTGDLLTGKGKQNFHRQRSSPIVTLRITLEFVDYANAVSFLC
jgi:hypothetical protein